MIAPNDLMILNVPIYVHDAWMTPVDAGRVQSAD